MPNLDAMVQNITFFVLVTDFKNSHMIITTHLFFFFSNYFLNGCKIIMSSFSEFDLSKVVLLNTKIKAVDMFQTPN